MPPVWDVVRRDVDRDMSGSATPRIPPTHSGAGRIVSVRLRPLALSERGLCLPTVSHSGGGTGRWGRPSVRYGFPLHFRGQPVASPPTVPAAHEPSGRARHRCCPTPRRRAPSSTRSRRPWILVAGGKRGQGGPSHGAGARPFVQRNGSSMRHSHGMEAGGPAARAATAPIVAGAGAAPQPLSGRRPPPPRGRPVDPRR